MIEQIVRENLKLIVDAYSVATNKPLSRISRRFYGNTEFLDAFFAGTHSISLNKLDELLDKLREEWPPGVVWPACRPVVMPRRLRKLSPAK